MDTPMHDAERPRLLAVGDAEAPTGLTRVSQAILTRLTSVFDIYQLGTNYGGDPHPHPWPIYQARRNGDLHGTRRLWPLIEELRPDLVWINNDLAVVADYLEALPKTGKRPPIVGYCPLEAGPADPALLKRLAGLDRLVLYTNFARAAVEAGRRKLAGNGGDPFPALDVSYHGVEAGSFHPIGAEPGAPRDRSAVRAQLWPQRPELLDAFIVLNANRNQPRKQIDITMRGFALFARGKPPSVKLCLHMGKKDLGWDIPALATQLGIGSRLIFDGRWPGPPRLDDETINRLYNACDVGLNTANAEGWGLVAFEHGATGAAQVVPAFSAPGELWRDAAELLRPSVILYNRELLFEEKIIEASTVAQSLERLYRDPSLLQQRSAAAYRLATDPMFSWDRLAEQWRRILLGMLASRQPTQPGAVRPQPQAAASSEAMAAGE